MDDLEKIAKVAKLCEQIKEIWSSKEPREVNYHELLDVLKKRYGIDDVR